MKLSEGWVPVALSSSIEAGTSAGALVCGSEIVVWRDESGHAHVWEDRCPHRGMRLSFGFVRGDHIACLYHGWQYDTAGQCRYIPAHPQLDVPQTIKVPTYRAEERFGIIWATTCETAEPPEAGLAAAGMAGGALPVRSLSIDRPIAAVEALFEAAGATVTAPGLRSIDRDGDVLLLAFQQATLEKTAVHIVAADPSAGSDRRRAHMRWAEGLRYRLEAETPAVAEVA